MKVAIRADASPDQGSGHVMRCLSLARELSKRGVDVTLFTSIADLEWLTTLVLQSKIRNKAIEPNSIFNNSIIWQEFDLAIVDSYQILAEDISCLNRITPVLAIIDGAHRNIKADFFLDQNLGSERNLVNSHFIGANLLFGSQYSLVRPEILVNRRSRIRTSLTPDSAKILIFFGGSDPYRGSSMVSHLLSKSILKNFTLIAPENDHAEIVQTLAQSSVDVLRFTDSLPRLIAEADAVISAAGTSAWDIATIGTPAGYFCVADNQMSSISAIEDFGVGMTLGHLNSLNKECNEVLEKIETLVFDDKVRSSFFKTSHDLFDGNGCGRVAQFIIATTLRKQVY